MGGRGADIVVETAGGTLPQALLAVAFGGFVGVVGFVGGYQTSLDIRQLIGPMVRIQGIAVGSRTQFEAMNRAIAAHGLKPVVEQIFPLECAADAFALMERGGHFGKIGVTSRQPILNATEQAGACDLSVICRGNIKGVAGDHEPLSDKLLEEVENNR